MSVGVLENTIIIGKHVPLTETAWKAEAAKLLQTLALSKAAAETEAAELYHDYVVEKGFTDQCFAQDPIGAVMDDRTYWGDLSFIPVT